MTRKDFIKKYNLKKAYRIQFLDGRTYVERMMYENDEGQRFVFYDNDLIVVRTFEHADGRTHYKLGAGYSWYN